jgi:hypothetical protein
MNLIIVGSLTKSPSENSSIRLVTMFAKYYGFDILIEASGKTKDKIYQNLKNYGAFDYIDDFIKYNQELGVRIDKKLEFPLTIVVNKITIENQESIIQQVNLFSKINYQ